MTNTLDFISIHIHLHHMQLGSRNHFILFLFFFKLSCTVYTSGFVGVFSEAYWIVYRVVCIKLYQCKMYIGCLYLFSYNKLYIYDIDTFSEFKFFFENVIVNVESKLKHIF